jgi:hypothetical protein
MQLNAPAMSLRQSEPIRERVGPHTRGPNQRMRFDFLARLQTHEGGSNFCDRFSEAHFNSTLRKLVLSICTQSVLKRGEHFFWAAVSQHAGEQTVNADRGR